MKFKLNKYFLAILFSLSILSINAQEVISEDFLEDIENNVKTMWSENIPAFATNITPEKYKNESAIIIGYKRSVTIDKKSRTGFFTRGERSLLFFENVRFKIKLNDRNSVKSFTEIYFRYKEKEDGFSARITKPNGKVNGVSLSDAVGVESTSDMPEFFKSFFDQESGNQRRYYKVAIPDLEPGDILEYVTVTKSKLNVAYSGYIEFSPQYEVCNKSYPILFNQIAIETDDKSFFKSMSLNGAPDFKKEPSVDEFFRYVFTDSDRGVEKDVNFIKAFQVYPLTKFQVIYSNKENVKGALIGQKGEIKTGFSKEELAKKAWEDYAQVGSYLYNGGAYTVQNYVDVTWAELKKLDARDWSEKDYINKVYYRIRNSVLFRDTYMSDKVFAFIFSSLLNQRDIKSDLVISISNSIGKLKDVLFDQEIKYAIRVNNVFYYNCTEHSNPGELVESLLGNEAYIIKEPAKRGGAQEITPVTLADASSAENQSTYVVNASLAADMNTMSISRVSTYTGLSKTRNIDDALRYTPYILDDWKYYGGNSPADKMKPKEEDEYYASVKALKDNYNEAKPEFVRSELQKEFSQKVKYKKFNLDSDGRSLKKKDLSFTEDFEIAGALRKAGKKYLVNIPGLVGSQLQIKKEERIRKYDMNVGCARTLTWTINFKIPEGYLVDGLKELNTSVDNEVGSYSSVAEEQGGVVVLKIRKEYKKANVSKDKWKDMLSFIDAAYNNSFRYILLTPKN
jgi:hypothetical protein